MKKLTANRQQLTAAFRTVRKQIQTTPIDQVQRQ